MQPLAIAILAAGASRRMGRPKQLLSYNGTSLVQHAIDIAKETRQTPVLLVVGANEKEVLAQIQAEGVTIVRNEEWEEGMASSIRAAVLEVKDRARAIMFLNCDQPLLTSASLNALIDRFRPPEYSLVAAEYGGVAGSPAIFDAGFFNELLELKGDVGAKSIIKMHEGQVAKVETPNADIDVDTESDWRTINQIEGL